MADGDHHTRRREYLAGTLTRAELPEDPLTLFDAWLEAAVSAGAKDATAMALATVDNRQVPSVRIVLLKSHSAEGFTFFTDYRSQKGREIAGNPTASAVFYWRDFDRQVFFRDPNWMTRRTVDQSSLGDRASVVLHQGAAALNSEKTHVTPKFDLGPEEVGPRRSR